MKNSTIVSAIVRWSIFCNSIFRIINRNNSFTCNRSKCIWSRRTFTDLDIYYEKQEKLNIYEALNEAKNTNTKIQKMVSQVENPELSNNISEIHTTVSKIIETVEKKPDKYKKMNNFFGYYLPVTINILTKYDEIENQKLNTEDSKKFMESTQKMVKKINEAFKKQLSNLYQSDMIDTDAEMKVFDTMLKSDGYDVDDNDFKI